MKEFHKVNESAVICGEEEAATLTNTASPFGLPQDTPFGLSDRQVRRGSGGAPTGGDCHANDLLTVTYLVGGDCHAKERLAVTCPGGRRLPTFSIPSSGARRLVETLRLRLPAKKTAGQAG
jgi:hypothetical protein